MDAEPHSQPLTAEQRVRLNAEEAETGLLQLSHSPSVTVRLSVSHLQFTRFFNLMLPGKKRLRKQGTVILPLAANHLLIEK